MSSCTGPHIGYGVQRLFDSQQQFLRAGHAVYLRVKNFPDVANVKWAQLGFSITPTGTNVGTTDILIAPPPSVAYVSVHNIGQSNGKLRFGARTFSISATFVSKQMTAQGLTNPELVWRGPTVLGLVTDGHLFSIEDIHAHEYGAMTIEWVLTCNALDMK